MDLSSVILYCVAAIAIVSRYVRALTPLFGWIPPKWGWLPSAVLAVAGVLTDGFQTCQTWDEFGLVIVKAIVVTALAAQAGLHFLPLEEKE